MHASDTEGVEFLVYQLKGVVYQQYDKWEAIKGEDVELAIQKEFSDAFLHRLFQQDMRKVKDEDFMNLKQGKMNVKESTLKFNQLPCYALDWVLNMRF